MWNTSRKPATMRDYFHFVVLLVSMAAFLGSVNVIKSGSRIPQPELGQTHQYQLGKQNAAAVYLDRPHVALVIGLQAPFVLYIMGQVVWNLYKLGRWAMENKSRERG